MSSARGHLRPLSASNGAVTSNHPRRPTPPSFRKVIDLWIPRRFFRHNGVEARAFVDWANDVITTRGLIMYDGQVLTTPLTDTISDGVIVAEPKTIPRELIAGVVAGEPVDGQATASEEFMLFTSWRRVGANTEVIFEHQQPGGTLDLSAHDVPPAREWGEPQQAFFGLVNPYQMIEDGDEYTPCHIGCVLEAPYLEAGERIVALLHGESESYYVNCRCHYAEIVYTTKRRLVCMACGAMHAVLRDDLPIAARSVLTAEEWTDLFDDSGWRRDEEVDLPIVDFRSVEDAPTIWSTDQWDEARHEFVFFARSSPEVVEAAIRGTERDPSVFLEAGWSRIESAPPPAHQIADDSIDVDLLENAGHALSEGVRRFLEARCDSSRLVHAIPDIFRGLELLLKARLQQEGPDALADHPNNPTVIQRLSLAGVHLSPAELETVKRLRRLRNELQHGGAKFNYRSGLALARGAILLSNRIALADFEVWMGDLLDPNDLWAMLRIPEFAATAAHVTAIRLEAVKSSPGAAISGCGRCEREAMVRRHPNTGALCLYCGFVPVHDDVEVHAPGKGDALDIS